MGRCLIKPSKETNLFSFLKTTPNIQLSSNVIIRLSKRFGITTGTFNILISEYRKGGAYGEN